MDNSCPVCRSRIIIKRSYPKVENGDTPDLPTKLYEVLEFSCLNDKCKQYGVVTDTQAQERDLG